MLRTSDKSLESVIAFVTIDEHFERLVVCFPASPLDSQSKKAVIESCEHGLVVVDSRSQTTGFCI